MKRSVLVLCGLCLPLQIYSQGFIAFNNYGAGGSPYAPIYAPETGNPQLQKWGNAADAYPPGTQTYSGAPLSGNGFNVEAWYSLAPFSDVFALNTTATEIPGSLITFNLGGGFFANGAPALPGVLTTPVYLQVRAWDNGGGQYSTWDQAWAAAQSGNGPAVGWSKVFSQPVAFGLAAPNGLENFESFNIFIVPEPSTFSLLLLCGLSLRAVRKQAKSQ